MLRDQILDELDQTKCRPLETGPREGHSLQDRCLHAPAFTGGQRTELAPKALSLYPRHRRAL